MPDHGPIPLALHYLKRAFYISIILDKLLRPQMVSALDPISSHIYTFNSTSQGVQDGPTAEVFLTQQSDFEQLEIDFTAKSGPTDNTAKLSFDLSGAPDVKVIDSQCTGTGDNGAAKFKCTQTITDPDNKTQVISLVKIADKDGKPGCFKTENTIVSELNYVGEDGQPVTEKQIVNVGGCHEVFLPVVGK